MYRLFHILTPIGLLLCLSGMARAQSLDFTLASEELTAPQGSSVDFTSTLTNASATDALSLNGSAVTFDFTSAHLTLTDDFATTPYDLTDSSGVEPTWTGTLFSISVAPSTPLGSYAGSYEIDYSDTSIPSSFYSSTVNFQVDVTAGETLPAPTPEPGNVVLLCGFIGAGILFLACGGHRNLKASNDKENLQQ